MSNRYRLLGDLFAAPREIRLAGRDYVVGELTIGDLAELDGPAIAARPDPLAGVRDLLGAASVPPGRRADFDRALGRAEGLDDDDLGPRGDPAALAGEEALALLRVALRPRYPEVAADDDSLLAILEDLAPGEFPALVEATYRPEPFAQLVGALDRFCGTEGDPSEDGPDWWALVDAVSSSHGLPYDQVRGMTARQFANALAGGKPGGRVARPGEDYVATALAWERWLAGTDPDPGGGATDGG